jgi:hypothetical protein
MENIKEFVPLLQTLSWVALILALAFRYRKETCSILETMRNRIEEGGGFAIGPLKFEKLKSDVRKGSFISFEISAT